MDSRWKIASLLITFITLLSACGSHDMSDLEQYIDEKKQRKNPRVDPIPPIVLLPPVVYDADNYRDPFRSIENQEAAVDDQNIATAEDCEAPDRNRNRLGLEAVPLDVLKMVGTIADLNNGDLNALVEDQQGVLHTISIGDYVGQNYGRVDFITPSQVEITELRPDGKGCWMEVEASIKLADAT